MKTVIIGNGQWLEVGAGASYARALRDGMPAGVTSAGRTHVEQVILFLRNYVLQAKGNGPYGDVRWWEGRRYVRVTKISVAPPGSWYSRHELGLSLDLPAGGPREWMRTHGIEYGWVPNIVPSEPWHFEYQAYRDKFRDTPAPTPPAPEPPDEKPEPDQENDMILIRQSEQGKPMFGAVVLLSGDLIFPIIDVPHMQKFEAIGVKRVDVVYDQYRLFADRAIVGA